jgi:hypothetical protein
MFMGFTPSTTFPTVAANSVISTSAALVSGPNYLYVNSRRYGQIAGLYLPTGAIGGGVTGPQMAKIPINVGSGGVIYWQDPDPQKWFDIENLPILNRLRGSYNNDSNLSIIYIGNEINYKYMNLILDKLGMDNNKLITIDENDVAVDFNNYALVYHLDFKAKATLQNKIKVRNLQLASQVLERASFTEMGTKFAVPVYPFTKLGSSYDFKAKNYTSTYKGSTPHLYLNRHSGWRIRKASDDLLERGISIPINFQEAPEFEIKGVQMWIRYSESAFPAVETRLFSLEHNLGVYDFYVISDSSTQRGFVYGKDRFTDSILDGVQYYVNGSLVERPYLVNQEWLVLGVQFPTNVSFNNDVGRLNLNGPFTYNNVSAYLITNLERAQTVVYNNWGQVAEQTWDYWESSFSWGRMLIIDSNSIGILNFGDIYIRDEDAPV